MFQLCDFDIVTMNALAFPIRQHGVHGRQLFWRAGIEALRIVGAALDCFGLVQDADLSHHARQGLLAEVGFGVLVHSATVACVETIVPIHEEAHPGQIVFELEQVQVDSVHGLDTYANELSSQFGDFRVLTDNLPVEVGTGHSAFTAKNDKQWFSGLACLLFSFLVAVNPLDLAVHFLYRDFFGCRASCFPERQADQQGDENNPPNPGSASGIVHRLSLLKNKSLWWNPARLHRICLGTDVKEIPKQKKPGRAGDDMLCAVASQVNWRHGKSVKM